MKYTIDEEKRTVTIHSFGRDDTAGDLLDILQGYEDFTMLSYANQNIQKIQKITDSGYNPVITQNPYDVQYTSDRTSCCGGDCGCKEEK